jgi:flagella basal body P-ring formation protein FlgA
MRRLTLAATAFAALATTSPALAGQPVTLKPDVIDADGVVTLGELFLGAGAAAATPVASRTAQTLILNARAVQAAAWRAGLDWANAEGVSRIVVRSAESAAAAAPAATAAATRRNVDVLTYARSLSAGEIVQPEDLVWGKAAGAPADAPRDADDVIGLAAKRPLRAGASVQQHDVAAAQVVKTGEMVTVTYEDEGVSLSLQGKAVTSGAVGEVINIQNTQSKKVIQAVVAGPGEAVIGPAANQLKTSTRYALR